MKKQITKELSLILAFAMALSLVPTAALAAEPKVEGLGVASHTVAEILAFIQQHPATLDDPVKYKTAPSLSEPYSAGVLSDETAASALNMLNQARYIAGLHADVTLHESLSASASAATLLNCLNKTLSHVPSRPDVLAGAAYDQLFSTGRGGAISSNLGSGYSNLNTAIIKGWCADSDASNISALGHRRWVLNPAMGQTGFGFTNKYAAMRATDTSGSGREYNVAWPAQVMPVEYFGTNYAWSLSLGTSVNKEDVSVKLVRRSGDMTWNFSAVSSDGDFYVNNGSYGLTGCIIFQPKSLPTLKAGDVFDVTVTIRGGNTPREIRYSVSFFSLASGDLGDTTYPVAGGSITFSSGTGAIVGCDPNVIELNIPSEINGVPVTAIGDKAFYQCANLTSITIPKGVTRIGEQAFYACTGLTGVVLPDGVTSIGKNAFHACRNLTSVTIPGSLATIGYGAFQATGLTSVTIPRGVTTIGEYAFDSSGLTSVTIADSVTKIGDCAFISYETITDVYYSGSESQWNQIDISEKGNWQLIRATIHFNSPLPSAPSTPSTPSTPAPSDISVTVGGKAVEWTDAKPFIDSNSRTMVPLRAVADAMGLAVNWDENAREASFTGGGKTIYFPIDSSAARTSGGEAVQMDTAAVIVSGRTYAPVRYLAEYFGYTVGWDGAARTVSIK